MKEADRTIVFTQSIVARERPSLLLGRCGLRAGVTHSLLRRRTAAGRYASSRQDGLTSW